MVGAWCGAILALVGVGRITWRAFVAAVEAVIEKAIGRVWTDMDQIEARLDRLEGQVNELREQVQYMRELLLSYLSGSADGK